MAEAGSEFWFTNSMKASIVDECQTDVGDVGHSGLIGDLELALQMIEGNHGGIACACLDGGGRLGGICPD